MTTVQDVMKDPHNRKFNDFIRSLPTLREGHFENLKLEWDAEGSRYRFLVSRMTVADGAPKDHQVILEHKYLEGKLVSQGWRTFPH